MKNGRMGMGSWTACLSALALLAMPVFSSAAEKGPEGMSGMPGGHGGMKMDDHGKTRPGGHDMMKMGDKVFSGKVGSWTGEARLMDMKAHLAASGMKAAGAMPNSHHIALELGDAKTRAAVAEGKGTVTVTGPGKTESRSDFMFMQGHFGADVNLPKPGKYTFKVDIESGGKKGTASFSHTVK